MANDDDNINVNVNVNVNYNYDDDDDDSDDEAPDLIEILAPDDDVVVVHENSTTPLTGNNKHDTTNNDNDNDNDNNNDNDETATTSTTTTAACPVTILSGFLGSGKTTLIQYILRSPDHGRRIAVIENEFGEGLAIESLIARDGIHDDGENNSGRPSLQDLIELPNGCVCCTVKDSLVATLENLITKRADLDYILIEASGMADPGPIASVFWLDDALESRLRLDGIVALVDGKHILEQLDETEEAARQIAYADRIVLNKVDLLEGGGGDGHQQLQQQKQHQSAAARARTKAATVLNTNTNNTAKQAKTPSVVEVERALRSIHPTAPILKTSFSQIPNLDWILDADCFSGFESLKDVQTGFETTAEEKGSLETTDHNHHDPNRDHQDDHDHPDRGHQHDDENDKYDDHDCSECCHEDNENHDDHDEHDHHNHHNRHDHHNHHEHQHKHKHKHKHEHKHTSSITTVALEHPGSVDVRKLNAWLADILWPNQDETDTVLTALLKSQEKDNDNNSEAEAETETKATEGTSNESITEPIPEATEPITSHVSKNKDKTNNTEQQIFRMKGIVSVFSCEDYFEEPTTAIAEGGDDIDEAADIAIGADSVALTDTDTDERRFIVQAVYDLWDIQPVTSKDLYWDMDEERIGKIVVIGKFLQEETLRAGFYACFD